ncbi:MAG: DUF1844 domain-containing protein [Deltaproteobacteria bacterium]|nr:DUF1844 domain-containing protein [Deltaproteobacteria bacterium]
MTEGNDEEKGFVIKDRRRFSGEGEARAESGTEEKPAEKITDQQKAAKEEAPEEQSGGRERREPGPGEQAQESEEEDYVLPEVNFATFILSLHTSALFHFGELPDPVTNERRKNIAAAKQTIDIVDMLKKKTQGNLEEEEQHLIDGVLYELRMRYVKEAKE